jgi:hypothetical protein
MDWFWRAVFAGLALASVSAWQHGHYLKAEACALGLMAGWLVRVYFWPYAACWACRGRKTNLGSSRNRYGSCWRCKGSGMRQVRGSKAVHKAVRGIRGRAWRSGK